MDFAAVLRSVPEKGTGPPKAITAPAAPSAETPKMGKSASRQATNGRRRRPIAARSGAKPLKTKAGPTSARFVILERHGVKLQPVIDELVAELACDFRLQLFNFFGLEFEHFPGPEIDQMVVV